MTIPVGASPKLLPRVWLAVVGLSLMVASEYAIRQRGLGRSLGGRPDAQILLEVVVYGVAIVFLFFQLVEPPRRGRLPVLLMAMWAFTLAMFFAAFYSPFPELALVRAGQLMVAASLGHLVARHASEQALHRLGHAFVVVVSASVVAGVVLPKGVIVGAPGRFHWLYVHPNIAAVFVGIALVILLAYLLHGDRRSVPWSNRVYGALFALNLAAMLATRSRGALAGTVLSALAVAYAAAPRRRKLDLAVMGAAIVVLTMLLAGSDILLFLQRGESAEQIGSLNSRTSVWTQGWELFGQRPLFGHGFMSARGVFVENFGLGGAHNAFFEVLVNAGIFGVTWWIALLVLAFRSAGRLVSRHRRHPDGPLLLGMLVFMVMSATTQGGLGQAATVQSIWLFLVVGWLIAADRLARDAPSMASGGAADGPIPRPSRSARPY
ncbi:MAG: O-antigen ligase family protein [Actinomycetota bacterium]|nr:O-antigen ligase family protein [Actinomycetota bacterium]